MKIINKINLLLLVQILVSCGGSGETVKPEPIIFTLNIQDSTIEENSTYESDTLTTVGSTPKGLVTYLLAGDDAQLFSINTTLNIVSMSAQNFERPSDLNSNNLYTYTLKAIDEEGNNAVSTVIIRVLDTTEVVSFTINATTNIAIIEGDGYVETPQLNGDEPIGNVSFSVSGVDGALFSIDATSGTITMPKLYFNKPQDSNNDNIYQFTLTAIDEDGNIAVKNFSWSILAIPLKFLTPSMDILMYRGVENDEVIISSLDASLQSCSVLETEFTDLGLVVSKSQDSLACVIDGNPNKIVESSQTFTLKASNSLGDVDITLSIKVLDPLIITEIGNTYYTSVPIWFEIYNQSGYTVNLNQYRLRSYFSDGNPVSIRIFSFPNKEVNSGKYIIIRGDIEGNFSHLNVDDSPVLYIKEANFYPTFDYVNDKTLGFVELLSLDESQTIDFVVFNTQNTTTPIGTNINPEPWNGNPVEGLPDLENVYGYSLARQFSNQRYLDTNTANDWQQTEFATFAGHNDVISSVDLDNDGIPDSSEVEGSTFGGLPLYEWGARKEQKDLFIEIDYMVPTSSDKQKVRFMHPDLRTSAPTKAALQKITAVFEEKGYTLHFDVGDLFDNQEGINTTEMDLGGGNPLQYYPEITLNALPTNSNDVIDLQKLKTTNMNPARKQIFYYMVFANNYHNLRIGGIAEVFGNDSIILTNQLESTPYNSLQFNHYLAAITMHEFGHNLGLRHGGDVDTNYKPNYLSVMNYMYSFNGVPEVGNNEGDRYYWANFESEPNCGNITSNSQLTNSPFTSNFNIDFSNGSGQPMDESAGVFDSAGLGRVNSNAVDFNCNGIIDSVSAGFNLNPQNGPNSTEVHKDYDDWGNIDIIFRRSYQTDNNDSTQKSNYSPTLKKSSPKEKKILSHGLMGIRSKIKSIYVDRIGNDIQPVADEY